METSYGDWQPGHLKLQAPELYVLLHGPDAKPAEVFKLALRELVGRDIVRPAILQQGSGRTTTRTAILLPGTKPANDLGRSLRSVMDAYAGVTTRTTVEGAEGVAVRELAQALRARHGGKLGTWVEDEVLATLVERGLYNKEEYKRLGIFKATRYEPKPEGKAAQALLESSIERAKSEFSSWASDDPTRAAAFLAVAGSAVLLMPDLQPEIKRFRESGGADVGALVVGDTAERDFTPGSLDDLESELDVADTDIDYGGSDFDAGDGDGGDGGNGGGD